VLVARRRAKPPRHQLDLRLDGAPKAGIDDQIAARMSDVGGTFSAYQGVASSANDLAKLDLVTGAQDATFSPPGATANGFNGSVASLYASGTSLYVGGGFTAYQGAAGAANRIAKLDLTSGALDTTFSPAAANGFDQAVDALGGSASLLVVGGAFGAYQGTLLTRSLARLDPGTGGLQ
jgi:hypothetical protein